MLFEEISIPLYKLTEGRVTKTPFGALFENPGNQQLLGMLKRNLTKHLQGNTNRDEAFVRGFADYKNNIFWMWDPYRATHDQMGKYISSLVDVEYGYDDDERPVGMLPIIIADHPITEKTIGFSAPDRNAWSHPAVKSSLRGLPLERDRLGDYDMKYEDVI